MTRIAEIYSSNNDYKVIFYIEFIDSEYYNVKLYNNFNGNIIYTYKQNKFCNDCFNKFITIKNKIWWFGCKNYQSKIIINCNDSKIFIDPDNQRLIDYNYIFIWSGNYILSPLHNYILIEGYIFNNDINIYQLYDISNLQDSKLINISNTNTNLIDLNRSYLDLNINFIFGDIYLLDYKFSYNFLYDNYIILYIYNNTSLIDIYGYYEIL